MPDIGAPELLVILLLIIAGFGASCIADLGGALGRSIREFRRGLHEEDNGNGWSVASQGDRPKSFQH